MSVPRPSARRVLRALGRHRRAAGAAAASAAAAATLGSVVPLVVAIAIDDGVIARRPRILVVTAAVLALILAAQVVATRLERAAAGRFAQHTIADVRKRALDHLLRLDIDFFLRERAGRLVSRLTTDVDALEAFAVSGLSLFVNIVMVSSVTLSLMVIQSPRMTLVTVAVVPPLALVTVWFQRSAYRAQLDVREQTAALLSRLNESLVGMRIVQAYGFEEVHKLAFREANQDTYAAKMRVSKVGSVYYGAVEFLQTVALLLVVWFGALFVRDGHVAPGVVVAFTLYAGRLFQPIEQFVEFSSQFQAASAALAKLFAFADERPRVATTRRAVPLRAGPGRVDLERVSFRYHPEDRDVVRDVTFTIEPGERVALVGGSGAGKSTLAKLIGRFYDPTAGRIRIDGQDLRTLTLASLRRALALVPQEGFLFDGTVADNVAIARPGATRADVERTCAALGALEVLEVLPRGLDAHISNRGLSLAAGQRQLIGLARAFIADPRVLILDEATSNLDPATRALVEAALVRVLAGRTAIVIAHRADTVLRADRVVVLEAGGVAQLGPPRELASSGGAFARWLASDRTGGVRAG